MISTIRSRVSFFMNEFGKLGFIDYKGGLRRNGGLHVHSSLLNVVLHDQSIFRTHFSASVRSPVSFSHARRVDSIPANRDCRWPPIARLIRCRVCMRQFRT
jgi:hypothetical protein